MLSAQGRKPTFSLFGPYPPSVFVLAWTCKTSARWHGVSLDLASVCSAVQLQVDAAVSCHATLQGHAQSKFWSLLPVLLPQRMMDVIDRPAACRLHLAQWIEYRKDRPTRHTALYTHKEVFTATAAHVHCPMAHPLDRALRQMGCRGTRTSMSAPRPVARVSTSWPRPIWRMLARSAPVWDESMTLADLKAQLDAAVEQEDYDLAARIRDALQWVTRCAALLCMDAGRCVLIGGFSEAAKVQLPRACFTCWATAAGRLYQQGAWASSRALHPSCPCLPGQHAQSRGPAPHHHPARITLTPF